jgi:hypothetical protein
MLKNANRWSSVSICGFRGRERANGSKLQGYYFLKNSNKKQEKFLDIDNNEIY